MPPAGGAASNSTREDSRQTAPAQVGVLGRAVWAGDGTQTSSEKTAGGRRPSVERMLWRLGVELRSHLPLEGMEETESEQEEPSQGRPLPPKPESHVTEVGLPVSEETAAER